MKHIFLIVLVSGSLCSMEERPNELNRKFEDRSLEELHAISQRIQQDNEERTKELTPEETAILKKILKTGNGWFWRNH